MSGRDKSDRHSGSALYRIGAVADLLRLSGTYDIERIKPLIHPEVRVVAAPGVAPQPTRPGREGFLDYFREAEAKGILVEPDACEIHACPSGKVLVTGCPLFSTGGATTEGSAYHIYAFRDGLICGLETRIVREAAEDAALDPDAAVEITDPERGRDRGTTARVSRDRQAFAESRFGSDAVTNLKAAFETSRNAMLITDDDRRWVTGNSASADLLGVSVNQIPWLMIDDIVSPGSVDKLHTRWKAFLDRGSAEGWTRLRLAEGRLIAIEYSATAEVLPGRHLVILKKPDEYFPALPRSSGFSS
ncbi:MAG: two-component system, sporulation sensor kinase [Solirubrobacterales bacterium]|jgi:PAS domain-containing protein|nr:two-component system, sporulation sensor kinase [Solirubrobacterales bacterium]